MKFKADWFAVPPGAIHPKWYREGEDCPVELVEEAASVDVLATAVKASRKAPETK